MSNCFFEPAEQRRIQCQIRADIENAFQQALSSIALRRVHCASADGQAILWGTVADAESRILAEHLAAHVDNVVSVLNRIQVDESAEFGPPAGTRTHSPCLVYPA